MHGKCTLDEGKQVTMEAPSEDQDDLAGGPLYELDPDGDTILVVRNVPKYLPLDMKQLKPDILGGLEELPKPPGPSGTASSGAEELGAERSGREESGAEQSEKEPSSEDKIDQRPAPLLIKASSRHLILSSQHFSRMLEGRFREAAELRSTGRIRIPVDDWKAITFLLLTAIIHGKTRAIPRRVSLQTLTDIAVLVDYYECYEAVELFADLWIDNLEKNHGLPTSCDQNAFNWLFISWVFNRPTVFKTVTAVVQTQSSNVIQPGGLPIPKPILDALNKSRCAGIQLIIDSLHGLFNRYLDGGVQCRGPSGVFSYCQCLDHKICSDTGLGALTRHMMKMNLFAPKPELPFPGIGFNQLMKDCRERMTSYPSRNHNCCQLSHQIDYIMSVIRTPDGLNLDAYTFLKLRDIKYMSNSAVAPISYFTNISGLTQSVRS